MMSFLRIVHGNPRTLFGIIRYVKDTGKTIPLLMDGFNIDPETAFEEMDFTQRIWNKTGGRQYKQFIFSFDSDVVLSRNTLMEIGRKIGAYYAVEYQILMVMHFNTANIHIHYILNTVNIFTGKKFSMTKRDMYNYKLYINQILQQYGLPLIALYTKDDQGQDNAFVDELP